MSLEEARQVTWIVPREPIGKLNDSGFLTRGRLEYVIERRFTRLAVT